MQRCPNCHWQIPDDAASCSYCGQRLHPDSSAEEERRRRMLRLHMFNAMRRKSPPSLPALIGALLTKPVTVAMAVLVVGGAAAGIGYARWATAPTSFVIATDLDNAQIVRIDLVTGHTTVLLSNKVLPGGPDSLIFISGTQILIDFPGNGEIGVGDIQRDTYTSIGTELGGSLRDMALRPDGSSVLIADTNGGNILEYHLANRRVTTFVQNLGGVQGLVFDADGNLYAAVGSQVVQLDPASGKQIKTFDLPAGSDGMAYDRHRNMLDIAAGSAIVTLDPKTGTTSMLLDNVGGDGVAVDRQGNLFIANGTGVVELNTSNQVLNVIPNISGAYWDDVAPLSGSGAASY
jgi:hypothetical protein